MMRNVNGMWPWWHLIHTQLPAHYSCTNPPQELIDTTFESLSVNEGVLVDIPLPTHSNGLIKATPTLSSANSPPCLVRQQPNAAGPISKDTDNSSSPSSRLLRRPQHRLESNSTTDPRCLQEGCPEAPPRPCTRRLARTRSTHQEVPADQRCLLHSFRCDAPPRVRRSTILWLRLRRVGCNC